MTREDRGGSERFVNRIVAPDEVIRLEEPKALRGWERWDADAVAAGKPGEVKEITGKENLLIKGNNLFALHSLKAHLGKRVATEGVKLIYIDPPYNTGNDGFRYNDRFTHSTWLTFMRNRLEVARDLLRDDGAIFVNLDDGEAHYCKVLMDEIFGRELFVANIAWQKRTSADGRVNLGDAFDHILVYAKPEAREKLSLLPLTSEHEAEFKNPDDDPRGPWVSTDFTAQGYRPNQMYEITTPAGVTYCPPPGRCWGNIEENFQKLHEDSRMWYGVSGDARPRVKTYLSEAEGVRSWTWWPNTQTGHNQEARKELIQLFDAETVKEHTPKPERLLQRIVQLATGRGELVLDFFVGSGTTAAVAHKMGRRWIAVEQMDYVRDLTAERLKKVVAGEQGGVSKAVDWPEKGGGNFIYAEIASEGQDFLARLDAAEEDALDALRDELAEAPFLRHEVDPEALKAADWAEVSASVKRRTLREAVAADHLYVNASDMDDEMHGLSIEDRKLSRAFYGLPEAAE